MRETDTGSVQRRPGISRVLFLVALALLAGYVALMASMGVTSPFVIVTGSSMEPTYHHGDLLLVSSVIPASIDVDDVIVFRTPRKGVSEGLPTRIAHRVVGIQPIDGMLGYQTQGDNSDRDSFTVPSNLVIGQVHTNLGPIGKPLIMLGSMKLLFMIGLPIALLAGVFWAITRRDDEEYEDEERVADVGATPLQGVQDEGPATTNSHRPGFEARYADRKSNRAVDQAKKKLLDERLSPGARLAFDGVIDRLDSIRHKRDAPGGPE